MRAFVALELPDPVRRAAAALGERMLPLGDVRPVPEHQLHLTLKFLGDLGERTVEDLGRAVAAEPWPTPSLRLAGLGRFPAGGAPRVLWAGVDGDLAALAAMAARAEALASAVGVPAETRPFRAHVTLGRCRSPRGAAALRAFVRAHATVEVAGPFAPPAVTLFRSDVGRDGAVHHALVRAPLPSR